MCTIQVFRFCCGVRYVMCTIQVFRCGCGVCYVMCTFQVFRCGCGVRGDRAGDPEVRPKSDGKGSHPQLQHEVRCCRPGQSEPPLLPLSLLRVLYRTCLCFSCQPCTGSVSASPVGPVHDLSLLLLSALYRIYLCLPCQCCTGSVSASPVSSVQDLSLPLLPVLYRICLCFSCQPCADTRQTFCRQNF